MLLPALLLTLAAQGPLAPAPSAALQASVRVEIGRALLVSEDHPRARLRAGERQAVAGAAHLEVRTGSRATITWPGRGTLAVEGPAALEWRVADGAHARTTRALPEAGLWIELHEVRRAAFEGRRGQHRLGLPGGWSLLAGGQAFQLTSSSSGAVRVDHQAGKPLALRWGHDSGLARPDLWLAEGQGLTLGSGPPSRRDATQGVAPWRATSWPWRIERSTPAESPAATFVRPQVRPSGDAPLLTAPLPAEPPPLTSARPVTRGVAPVEPPITSHEVRVVSETTLRQPEPEPANGYESLGGFAVERSPFVELRRFPNGRARVLVSSDAPRSMRCLVGGEAHRLEPGGVLVLEPDGAIGAIYGVLLEAH